MVARSLRELCSRLEYVRKSRTSCSGPCRRRCRSFSISRDSSAERRSTLVMRRVSSCIRLSCSSRNASITVVPAQCAANRVPAVGAQHVDVHVGEAGDDEASAPVDDPGARWRRALRRRPDARDAIAVDHDRRVGERRTTGAVDQRAPGDRDGPAVGLVHRSGIIADRPDGRSFWRRPHVSCYHCAPPAGRTGSTGRAASTSRCWLSTSGRATTSRCS